ncbi:RNA polymerase sigma-70 factor (ECF subfamily) [Sphingomonas leidyi]|uniref:RNA polymerase sigma factor n=1 Tax=Sphingomonas leidyi TaxID=68569 RepID=A0A7X5UZY3_9SPHN|nr:sigma-70 family RNA polymerase sigma factor [Sphingomonas leidyi]NIJ65328.1 RNA polymerase sigma-70 factor (ECF subfamily) [Sphingomonas leidyi]
MVDTPASANRERLVANLARVAKGDQAALRAVYDTTAAKLFGVCLRISGDREAAEDILQKVYLKVWDRAGRFDAERASPITWLCAIARNTAIDWRRANGSTAHLPESAAAIVEDDSPLAPEVIDAATQRARIFDCLDALDERPRHAIRAAFFDGLTYSQLAEAMAVPLGTLKSWVRRGLIQLKGCLDDA